MTNARTLESSIPARLDALPWSRWHARVVVALGATWLLDGLEVTVVGSLGAGLSVVLLDSAWIGPQAGWRVAFAFGAVLGVAILLVRGHVPESPRWLLTHGRETEAEAVVRAIETEVAAQHGPRAAAISIFYAIGTGVGGFAGPALFGTLIAAGSREALFAGYAGAAALMCAAALVAAALGVDAERRPLEAVAPPLSASDSRD